MQTVTKSIQLLASCVIEDNFKEWFGQKPIIASKGSSINIAR